MKRKGLKVLTLVWLVILIALLPLVSACGTKVQPGQVLKIGMMTPSTGPVPEKGIPGQHGRQSGPGAYRG